ncbi:unnamed protein product [Acanthoscelides obtectus]|uniref:Uncharacterized protein n=1 Tax=Acanthoscelides obtectus TaxID=200917 RepID=A0A9P0MJS1_ACAOB|nr:unnamed protein product [Acanthoscelides obtectus]CAK1680767.1 hypothetical protein AOBTE_LOCUS32870 [Acanthoscelides obtectus]
MSSSQKVIDTVSDEFVRRIEVNVLNSTNRRFQNIQNTNTSKRILPTTISKRHYDDDDDTTEGSKFCDNCNHYFCFCRESVTIHPVRQTTTTTTTSDHQQVDLYCYEKIPKSERGCPSKIQGGFVNIFTLKRTLRRKPAHSL